MGTEKGKPTVKPAHVLEADVVITKARASAVASDDRARRASRRLTAAAKRLVLDVQAQHIAQAGTDTQLDPAVVAGAAKQFAAKNQLPDPVAVECVARAMDQLALTTARERLLGQQQAVQTLAAVAESRPRPPVPTYEAHEIPAAVKARNERNNWRTRKTG